MSSAARTIYVSTIMIVIGLSIIQSHMFTVNSNANEVYAKKYTNNFEQAGSLVNDCSGDDQSNIICVNNDPQAQGEDNKITTPVRTIY